MFAKLVVLILVFGASGIGVLSVRQSRLQAVHEMAESRQRIRQLDEQAGEIRTMIMQSCTPQRVHSMIDGRDGFSPASSTPTQVELVQQVIESPPEQTPVAAAPQEEQGEGTVIFTLEDGTRVVFVRE